MISLFLNTSYLIPPTNPAFHLLVVSTGLFRGDPRRTDVCIKHKLQNYFISFFLLKVKEHCKRERRGRKIHLNIKNLL